MTDQFGIGAVTEEKGYKIETDEKLQRRPAALARLNSSCMEQTTGLPIIGAYCIPVPNLFLGSLFDKDT